MKKFICLILVPMMMVMALALSACGNKSVGFGNYSFKHIHFTDGVEGHCATVERWYDNDGGGIEVHTAEYDALWCAEGTYIMLESGEKCPYCD